MKRYLSIIAISMASITASAATLSPEAALHRAIGAQPARAASLDKSATTLYHTESIADMPAIYIFSRGAEKGFIAVSADDSTTPLLGYNTEGTLPESYSDLPDGMRYWIGSLAEQVAYNAEHPNNSPLRKTPTKENIDWKCSTKWNQSEPFNNQCPTLNNERCVTGCVATAMAQVLKYYEYPTKGKGSHSYKWANGGNRPLSFNYGSTTFQWSKMLDDYSGSYTTAQADAVATLMKACGYSVDMDYTPRSSGALAINMLRALIENFDYDQGCAYLGRDYYTLSEWEDLVYENIRDYGPVLYDGLSKDGGHQFVCDGYKDGYFHFNWGWGGTSDGFYLLTALDPIEQGIGGGEHAYNFDQNIVAYLQTEHTSSTFYHQIIWSGDFTIANSRVTLGNNASVYWHFYNYSYATIPSVSMGLLLTASDGSETYCNCGDIGELEPLYGIGGDPYDVYLPRTIKAGTYKVEPAWKDEFGEVRRMPVPVANRGSYVMTVSGNVATFSEPEPASVTVTDFTLESELYLGSPFRATATLSNENVSETYNKTLVVAVVSDSNAVAIGNEVNVTLSPGESIDWEYISPLNYKNAPSAGFYDLYLCEVVDESSLHPIADPLSVKLFNQSTPTFTVSDPYADEGQYFGNFHVYADINVTSGYFAGTLLLGLWEPDNNTSIGVYNSDYFALGGNSSLIGGAEKAPRKGTLHWNFSIPNGQENTTYRFAVYQDYETRLTQTMSATTGSGTSEVTEFEIEVPGITDRKFYTTTGVCLGSERPSNGIYIVRETLADGTVRTRRVALR